LIAVEFVYALECADEIREQSELEKCASCAGIDIIKSSIFSKFGIALENYVCTYTFKLNLNGQ
jgi:hypothetical protein